MTLNNKRIYCPDCQKLVKGTRQTVNSKISILCPKCQKPLWLQDDLRWKYIGQSETR